MIFTAPLLLLLLGLGAIVWGTKVVIDNAVAVAHHHRISDFFIGAVVLAIGSDLPELVVSIDAAFRQLAGQQTANLIVGNTIGSCFGQLGLVIGLAGMVGHLTLPRRQVVRHGAVLVVATLLLMLVGLDGRVHRLEGLAMALAFVTYLVYVLSEEGLVSGSGSGSASGTGTGEPSEPVSASAVSNWLRLAVGLAIVVASAELIVRTAMTLALQWDVDQAFIGIAIVGLGTSLPEVVISLAAVLRRRVGLSVGNLLGSNILDTLLPVGLAAAIAPLPFDPDLLAFDLPLLLGLTVLAIMLLYRRGGVRWPQGALVLGAYLSYLVVITLAL